jgi:hypothetical protein
MAQWLHFPELSVNLDNVDYILPGPDNLFSLYFAASDADGTQLSIKIDGEKAKVLCEEVGRPVPFRYDKVQPGFPTTLTTSLPCTALATTWSTKNSRAASDELADYQDAKYDDWRARKKTQKGLKVLANAPQKAHVSGPVGTICDEDDMSSIDFT